MPSSPLPPTPEVSTGAPAAEWRETTWLRAWGGNPRVGHDVEGIARSIERLGFGAPILARPDGEVIAGHGRLAAAKLLGLAVVPVRVMADLDDDEAHALALADNAYTDASHNDAALYAAAIEGLDEELARVLALPEPALPAPEPETTTAEPAAEPFTTEEIVEDAIAWFRAHGFPYPSPCVHVAKQAINALSRSDELATTETATRIADMWCPHRYERRAGKMKTPVEAFNDDRLLRWAIAFALNNGVSVGTKYLAQLSIASGTQACANFRPGFAAWLYRRFCKAGDRVLDCSHGFGGRLVGFLAARVPQHYVGIDPCTQTSEGVGRMARELGVADRVTLIRKPAEDVTPDEVGQVQFAFTSPPYWDREHYSNESTNSCNRYATGAAWREDFLHPMLALQFACLVSGGRAVVNIAALDQGAVPLDKWTIEEGESVGFVLSHVEEFSLPIAPRLGHESGAPKNEPVIVLVKP